MRILVKSDLSGVYFDSFVAQYKLLTPDLKFKIHCIKKPPTIKVRILIKSDLSGVRTLDPILKRDVLYQLS